MCGIAGFIGFERDHRAEDTIRAMTHRLAHRGPDDADWWLDEESGVALGHRRLSILDLSAAGRQPMQSASGRFVVTFNGEIYNHRALKAALDAAGAARRWQGHSDTETLVAALDAWGIDETLRRANGMFAIAAWDRRERILHLARDRLGEKPLYYGTQRGVFLFGSELKALTAHPAFGHEVDRRAVALFLQYRYVPAPFSIWKGVHKLPPGTRLAVRPGQSPGEPEPYWRLDEVAEHGQRHLRPGDERERVADLDALLRDAVSMRTEADVPLGAFLSGGIDSSAIVALMQAESRRPIRTFTVGFREEDYDEAGHAAAVARHLGTDHTALYVTPDDALEVIPRLPAIWDEPFSDPSMIPTYLLSKLTRAHVKVALSGDGGDELFGGYERYLRGASLWRRMSKLPRPVRSAAAASLGSDAVVRAGVILDGALGRRRLSLEHRLPLVAALLRRREPADFYSHFVSHWQDAFRIVKGADAVSPAIRGEPNLGDFRNAMMYRDMRDYLPDDILTKVDRASMAASLEVRVPLLDHRVVERAWQLPPSVKFRDGAGKWILRQVLYRYVPREIVERPKRGFAVPLDVWLRGPLRDWAEELLCERRIEQDGFFEPAPIRKKWIEHVNHRGSWHFYLWDVLMFQAWLDMQRSGGHLRCGAPPRPAGAAAAFGSRA